MTSTRKGSCVCGGVRFRANGSPESVFMCYCTHCAKNAGGPGQISAKFACEQVHVEQGAELLQSWILTDTLSKAEKHKVFCSRCGCTLWTIPMKHGGTHWIVRTSLIEDGLQQLPYNLEFFTSKKIWTSVEPVRSFETMPGY